MGLTTKDQQEGIGVEGVAEKQKDILYRDCDGGYMTKHLSKFIELYI